MAGQSFESETLGPAAIAGDRNALTASANEIADISSFFIALSKPFGWNAALMIWIGEMACSSPESEIAFNEEGRFAPMLCAAVSPGGP
jgi:hypothetical protein